MSKPNPANQPEPVAMRLTRLHRTFKHALAMQIRQLVVDMENAEFDFQVAQAKRDNLRIKKIA